MKFFAPSLLVFILLVGGFAAFKFAAPVGCNISGARAAFVLTGDSRRIPYATKKIKHGMPIYIIGAGAPDIPVEDGVIVESSSKTTYQNAIAIKEIVRENNLRHIALSTSVDHYTRAHYLVRKEIPNVKISACTVPLHGMPATRRLERWMMEYAKYIGTMLGLAH